MADRNATAKTAATIEDKPVKPPTKKKNKSSSEDKENQNKNEEDIICLTKDKDYQPKGKVDPPVRRQRISRAVKSELIEKLNKQWLNHSVK